MEVTLSRKVLSAEIGFLPENVNERSIFGPSAVNPEKGERKSTFQRIPVCEFMQLQDDA